MFDILQLKVMTYVLDWAVKLIYVAGKHIILALYAIHYLIYPFMHSLINQAIYLFIHQFLHSSFCLSYPSILAKSCILSLKLRILRNNHIKSSFICKNIQQKKYFVEYIFYGWSGKSYEFKTRWVYTFPVGVKSVCQESVWQHHIHINLCLAVLWRLAAICRFSSGHQAVPWRSGWHLVFLSGSPAPQFADDNPNSEAGPEPRRPFSSSLALVVWDWAGPPPGCTQGSLGCHALYHIIVLPSVWDWTFAIRPLSTFTSWSYRLAELLKSLALWCTS